MNKLLDKYFFESIVFSAFIVCGSFFFVIFGFGIPLNVSKVEYYSVLALWFFLDFFICLGIYGALDYMGKKS